MNEAGFTLRIDITGLCVLAHQPNYLHVLMPPTPVDGQPGVPKHHASLGFDLKSSSDGQIDCVSLDDTYVVISGDKGDVLCPSIPKSMIDLTDTFSATVPGQFVAPPGSAPPGPKSAASIVRIETGQAVANTAGHLFCVEGGKPARHLSWLVTWQTWVPGETLPLELQPMSNGSVKTLELHPINGVLRVMINNTPVDMDGPLQRYQQVRHFMAYYNWLGINEALPTFYDRVTSGLSAGAHGSTMEALMMNNAYTCIPACAEVG